MSKRGRNFSGAPAAAGRAARSLPPAPPAPGVPAAWRVVSLLALAAAVLGAYAGVLGNGWVLLDDPGYVTANPYVNQGWTLAGFRWFLHAGHVGNWHPLTSYSHMTDVQWFGLQPAGHHAMNLGFHVLNAVLLVLVLHRFTGAWWRSVLVGALFGLHPLGVESVAWVSERKNVLSTFLFLLTLAAYHRWTARPGAIRYALVAACFALGLLAKPMLVTLPFVLVLLDAWPLGRLAGPGVRPAAATPAAPRRTLAGLLFEKWPLFVLAAAASIVTLLVQRRGGAVYAALPLANRLTGAAAAYWRYIGFMLWPSGLAPFYPLHRVGAWPAALALAGLAATTALALRTLRSRPWLLVGWLWFLGVLVPVIGLVQVGMQACADRYMYLPILGLFVASAWALAELAGPRRKARIVVAAIAAGLLALLGVLTARQVALWKDSRTLFSYAIRAAGESVVAEEALGNAFSADSLPDQAILHLRRAIALEPSYWHAHFNLGVVLARQGRSDEALLEYRRALAIAPDDAPTLVGVALLEQAGGRLAEAAALYRRALARQPDLPGAMVQLGLIAARQGDAHGALEWMRRAEALAPSDPAVRLPLAAALLAVPGRAAEGADVLRTVLRDEPANPAALNGLAWLLATTPERGLRDPAAALGLAARAVAAGGGRDPNALDTQAAAQAAAGDFSAAQATARQAIKVAEQSGAALIAGKIRTHLESYRAGREWIDSTGVGSPAIAR